MNTFFALILSMLTILAPNSGAIDQATQAPAPQVEMKLSWEDSVLYEAGITFPDNATLTFTEVGNCGSALSPTGTGGGCTRTAEDGSKMVIVSPQVYGTPEGAHILLHEVAHATGTVDECTAEYFAHDHGSQWNLWSYPQCMTEND